MFGNWLPNPQHKVRRLSPAWQPGQPPPVPKLDRICEHAVFAADDDLQIYDWLHSKIRLAGVPGLLGQKQDAAPYSSLTYDVHFIVTKGFNVSPVFKLVTVGINADGKFYAGKRIKSDHLIITVGKPDEKKPTEPSAEVNQQHFARLIGQSVADALKDNQP